MKYSCTILLFIICLTFTFAQKKQAIYAEFGGNALIYSLNYDFAPIKNHDNFRLKAGVSYIGDPVIIGQVSYLFGKEKHFFELGAGFTTVTEAVTGDSGFQIYPNAALQYRYQHPRGFLFRIGFAPLYLPITGDGFEGLNIIYWAWPGVSFGYGF
ncbi:hypothetical protein [Portibacter marinus]|uniref:hypothetical protein n=1 Tax=Portibacter marinus TaxID=2898660 RepID=UPI001F3A5D51|nr:hypothetical protein [Portibacter marinus]